ncbi:hypothetical protein, conserved [Eimeria tenella]|uniref:Uncharacterized protein n=1 Tax=Eimeria tenella TaxID=5802 RepID=U6KJX3_EIMTE|nr:hypothetical protein, conserved [Eimeria tenella]CDJ38229.1 hypothetical protein, conserved [Eimeria tenella]|eukprot:XP_013229067.1 hypothetical protein, conserved [Eimeria tenella]
MDPFTFVRWLGVCVEPSVEEAQPAWWLELQRAEFLQREEEESGDVGQRNALPSVQQASVVSELRKRKVHFAAEQTAGADLCVYENDSEFVVSFAHPNMHGAGETGLPPWDARDLDDTEYIRQMLLPPTETPPPSLVGSSSASSLMELKCGSLPSDEENVFHEHCDTSTEGRI